MFTHLRAFFLLLFAASTLSALPESQQQAPAADVRKIVLNVVVTPKSGAPVSGLQQQDFTILDNKTPQTISSFDVNGGHVPIEVIIVIDAVNIGAEDVARQRQEIEKFLRTDRGILAFPTTIAISSDKGIEMQPEFSRDGNAISTSLEESDIGLRSIRRSAGFYGADERLNISLTSLQQLAEQEAPKPGRKIILWVSPGWPLLSGPGIEEQLSGKQQDRLFSQIQNFSSLLREGQVTLYSIDPLGTADVGLRTFYWQSFLKPVIKPSQVIPGNLALQVLATQSGGLALSSSNDIAGQLQKCIADTGAYYQIAYDQPRSDQPRQYHQIEIHLDKKGLTARTTQGYYAQQ